MTCLMAAHKSASDMCAFLATLENQAVLKTLADLGWWFSSVMSNSSTQCYYFQSPLTFVREVLGVGRTGRSRLQRGIQGRLAHLDPSSGLADVEPIGDVPARLLQLLGRDNRPAPALSPARSAAVNPALVRSRIRSRSN